MGKWVLAEADFGLPGMVFTLSMRSVLNGEFAHASWSGKGPEELAEMGKGLIEEVRPDLKGLAVVWMSSSVGNMSWEFGVVHPRIERLKLQGGEWPRERIERCAVCGGPRGKMDYRIEVAGRVVEVCSPKCAGIESEKKVLTGLFRDNPETSEGKYLVKRRDGTVPEWPSFVLGGRDPIAAVALRAYAEEAKLRFGETGWVAAIRRMADTFDNYRAEHGEGDPEAGPHRRDDPATVEEMKKGWSA